MTSVMIKNEMIEAVISTHGAELQSITHKETGLQYLWQGDARYWPRRAPVLFPIVGRLKNGKMRYQGREYLMSQHGFARDMEFNVVAIADDKVSLKCESTPDTKTIYPFEFQLSLEYRLIVDSIIVSAEVNNLSKEEVLYFSLGFHPGFRVPLDADLELSDYYITFNKDKEARIWQLEEGLLDDSTAKGMEDGKITLMQDTFEHDALIFKGLQSDQVTLKSDKSAHGVSLYVENFPYLGIWAKPGAPFVCIEPWHGITDSIHHNGAFMSKEGICKLAASEVFHCRFTVHCF